MTRFTAWLTQKWDRQSVPANIQDYQVTFSTPHGQRVLKHLIDSVYATVYEGSDPIAMSAHNARRSVVHEILENIDMAEQPDKYQVRRERT